MTHHISTKTMTIGIIIIVLSLISIITAIIYYNKGTDSSTTKLTVMISLIIVGLAGIIIVGIVFAKGEKKKSSIKSYDCSPGLGCLPLSHDSGAYKPDELEECERKCWKAPAGLYPASPMGHVPAAPQGGHVPAAPQGGHVPADPQGGPSQFRKALGTYCKNFFDENGKAKKITISEVAPILSGLNEILDLVKEGVDNHGVVIDNWDQLQKYIQPFQTICGSEEKWGQLDTQTKQILLTVLYNIDNYGSLLYETMNLASKDKAGDKMKIIIRKMINFISSNTTPGPASSGIQPHPSTGPASSPVKQALRYHRYRY